MQNNKVDYTNCITNLACSILQEFGVSPRHNTLALADEVLQAGYDNVILILLDGMGMHILEENAAEDGFFRSHLKGEYCSVYLPTTVAATTSVLSGLNPSEHGWLGWDCYYPEIDKNVTVFLNTLTDTKEPAADYPVAATFRPYENIVDQIRRAGGNASFASPYMEPYPQTYEEQTERILSLCKAPGKKFIYCYNPQPDGMMHRTGTTSRESKLSLAFLEEETKRLCEKLQETEGKTLVLVTADHGQLDPKGVCLLDFPKIVEALVRMPSLEPRTLNLFVKEEKKEEFPALFNGYFGDKFRLYTKEEVQTMELFGPGESHEALAGMLGDFIAVATGDLAIYFTYEDLYRQRGFHGGMTPEEIRIPLIAVDCTAPKEKDFVHVYAAQIPKERKIKEVFPGRRQVEIDKASNEEIKAQRYYSWKLLEYALEHSLGVSMEQCVFEKSENGKWGCDACAFSISHCKDVVVVAVSPKPVGIDCEGERKIQPRALAEKILSQGEMQAFAQHEEAVKKAFLLEKWTQKEALFKKAGEKVYLPKEYDTAKDTVSRHIYRTRIEMDGKCYELAVASDSAANTRLYMDVDLSE